MKLMWKRTAAPVVAAVQDQTTQAAELARIDGQDRLTDPRTNPAVRPHADRLRDEQHKLLLDAEHGRVRRRYRVEARRAGHAEKALEAIQEAREVSSPAKSVRVLHTRRNLYMWVSLATSLALAGGSAIGLEQVAGEYEHIPRGTGLVAEVGLTGLATVVILARSDLAQHSDTALRKSDWRNWALWALMVVPLAASMAANIHGGNFLGALCAGGAAAFSLFSYLVGVLFADAAKAQAEKVSGEEEISLRKVAIGDDLFSAPVNESNPEAQGTTLAVGSAAGPVTDRSGAGGSGRTRSEASRSEEDRSETSGTHRTQTQVPDRPETHTPDRSPEQVPDQTREEVPTGRSETRRTKTGPKKQTRTDSETDQHDRILSRLDEARAVDKQYLADHGRHIPAEKLRQALGIGKPAALELVRHIRGAHLDVAK